MLVARFPESDVNMLALRYDSILVRLWNIVHYNDLTVYVALMSLPDVSPQSKWP